MPMGLEFDLNMTNMLSIYVGFLDVIRICLWNTGTLPDLIVGGQVTYF